MPKNKIETFGFARYRYSSQKELFSNNLTGFLCQRDRDLFRILKSFQSKLRRGAHKLQNPSGESKWRHQENIKAEVIIRSGHH